MRKQPLRIFLLAHPRSDSVGLLAQELMRRFFEMPATGGLGIPVFLTPDDGNGLPPSWDGVGGINLDASEHTLVVVLADWRMAQRVDGGTGADWKRFLEDGAQRAPVGASPHHVFGVAIAKASGREDLDDREVFELGDTRHMLGVKKKPKARDGESRLDHTARVSSWAQTSADEIALQVAIRAIALLDKGAVSPVENAIQEAPVRVFLSHAKADLASNESDAVRSVQTAVRDMPIEDWFDAAEIPPGAEFEARLKEGVADSTILVAFLTDRYGSRPWCQREVLVAKELGVPIIVVDALSDGEPRNFPYLGNVPTVHWSGTDHLKGEDRAAAHRMAAERIVGRTVREALRFKHNRAKLTVTATEGEIVLASAPEALSLAWHKNETLDAPQRFLYPDPPLTRDEVKILEELRPGAIFTTPLSKIARSSKSSGIGRIAVSTSVSDDKQRSGLSPLHEESIFDEIHGYLLLAGLQIGYGGALQGDLAKGSNFTVRLFELVGGYGTIAENAGGAALQPIVNIAPWPVHRAYGDREIRLFGSIATLVRCPRPAVSDVPEPDDVLFPLNTSPFTLPDTPERRLAWTRSLTAMRWQATQDTGARLVIGGRLKGFSGVYPGVLEEAWMSIVTKKPVYIAGAFGGAARAAIDLLEGRERPEVTTHGLAQTVPHFQAVVDLARNRGLSLIESQIAGNSNVAEIERALAMPDAIIGSLKSAGLSGLSSALNNGLDDEENRELFQSLDGSRIAELVLTGLSRLE